MIKDLLMRFLFNNEFSKWFFCRYYGIPLEKEIFRIQKNAIHYWENRERNIAQCQVYQFSLWNHPLLKKIKYLFIILPLVVKNPIGFVFIGDTNDSSTNNKDTRLESSAATTNYGSSYLVIGKQGGGSTARTTQHYTLVSGSGTITKVSAFLYMESWDTGCVYNVHQLTQSGWTEAGATWNKYDGTNDWTSAGGDFNATIIDQVTISTGTWAEFVLMGTGSDNPLTLNWGDNVHLLFKSNNEGGTCATRIESKENALATGNVPYLRITYTVTSFIPSIMII